MLTEANVVEAVLAAGIAIRPLFVPVTGSTNSDLMAFATGGGREWTVEVAGQQSGGRGRLGRSWVSTPGSSLLVSVILRPDIPATEAPLLSLAAALAMAEACQAACAVRVRCKWPNDLVVNGRKIGGILAEAAVEEARPAHVVIGAGVNLEQVEGDLAPELRGRATSVVMEGGLADPAALLRAYLSRLRELYEPGGADLAGRVWARYVERSDTLGRLVRATTRTGMEVVGRAVAIDDSGALVVEDGDGGGRSTVGFGEVEHLR